MGMALALHTISDESIGKVLADPPLIWRVIGSDEVKRIADSLRSIDEHALRERFKPEEMMSLEIYPEIWDRDPKEDDTLGYCIEYYDSLRRFLTAAAGNSMGIALYIC